MKKWGNSLSIIIPSEIAGQQEIKAGDSVELGIIKKKRKSGEMREIMN